MKLIKRYPNRRLYDTELKRYITLADVRDYIKGYQSFEVVDSKTGDPLTRQVLLQVLTEMESEGHASVLTDKFLEEIIRLYDSRMSGMAGQWLEQAMVSLLGQQQQWQQELKRMQEFNPAQVFGAFFNPMGDRDKK
ncbi:polyhydroxyalkonate synthesis repressor, PhaR [Ferrimonas balearica DSM 9799]|uniref:Polyhydroxyalkonate synthesis repressor, PhaR n=1 Tax=Ferrimonas balearica (strain DSM 9799 / CCM 4581 / KCTC 23876 / PAT) TaxID=550540 RepID=E1SV09_FERBD|nr:polyhydroxyalkanoate synthesis repressor PhaR [Ferrimonas balearica]MBY6016819.1 polyhydroxyalkanoate synthesis repressor PhaR [Halomonas denitrificans]ADN76336.1 polyhydroxyalkonate synthesis repressor, PhaR [Ferrimonas balearica DSM 9799]MBW3139243.1 polyhydroxyalkanoate synthesis repressor PhaR [Ferrimonas balearica]MBW3163168.1 polyhydroxyalkanoate synthesis repressor PhaR [Ferrimonas balearica]MBY5980857.1 polyhydroxyalkanoate synthesis repressor PhaR [Ferrimonas balearica]